MTDGPLPGPAALPPPGAFDGHTHLDIMGLPVPGVLEAAAAMGISKVITVGTDLESSRWSLDCASLYDPVFAAVAIHPNDVSGLDIPTVAGQIEELAASPRVVAVGETGLDYYRDNAPPALQREWFRVHIEIAKRAGKVLMIHDREAHADVLSILSQAGPPERVVFHCFSGDAAMAKTCAEAGYVMSFAGNVTFPSADALREAAAAAPSDLILAETDAPFLTPVPHRGKPNSPAMTARTIRCLAEVKGMAVEAMCEQITATGARLYGW